ncbi:CE295 protein, partial [Eurystomus gularis]|nr:CE295 protein [Eurystomus gularis]
EQPERALCREQKRRSSKPPVTKVKLGLDLEQHELSVIPEVDTPKSSNISFADKTNYHGGEYSPVLALGELAYVKRHRCALREEGELPLSMTNYKEQICNGSLRQSKQSRRLLQEVLMMTAETSDDS